MAEKQVLLVEDDKTLSSVVRYNLEKEGYISFTAWDGVEALELARTKHPDLILLDVMLPRMDGFEVCRIIRQEAKTPIIMLTAKIGEGDKVHGLDLGADDYVAKPFSMRELMARIRALLRRTDVPEPSSSNGNLRVNDLVINQTHHTVTLQGEPLSLTPKEFDLLLFLVKSRGIVYNREQLLEKIWNDDYSSDTRTVDAHIRNLREKIESDPSKPALILTVRGVGYKFLD